MKTGSVYPRGLTGAGSIDDRDVSVLGCSFPGRKWSLLKTVA